MIKNILILFLINIILTYSQNTEDYENPMGQKIGFFNHEDGETPTEFNLRFTPIPRSLYSGTKMTIYFPPNTKGGKDYNEAYCYFRLRQKPMRRYYCLSPHINAKRAGNRASIMSCTVPLDIIAENMDDVLITCGSLLFKPEDTNEYYSSWGHILVNNDQRIEFQFADKVADNNPFPIRPWE